MAERDFCKRVCSISSFWRTKCSYSKPSTSSSLQKKLLDEESLVESEAETQHKKPGWKAMPYILGPCMMQNICRYIDTWWWSGFDENHIRVVTLICNFCAGNETIERLATFGMTANFMVYLMKEYNMDQVLASNILNTWLGVCNIIPVFGAFIADAYFGKFKTIAAASFASLLVPFHSSSHNWSVTIRLIT